MSAQKHDIGHQKRLKQGKDPRTQPNGEALARKLVEDGLAAPIILTTYRRTHGDTK
ncbi:hypothetical protein [Paenarthrobacter ureafaciens]|uniref:hypothetical protein n=1 Tax=Paenarthrobacter ureafaciens TaxID=37931 RepID=UPI001C2BD94B|nr:hypothetical protein [Paenarthrobacter ureafaciens]UOD81983.1 hypothetical protein MQZ73_03595 [Paenarthrobacter ureafaciens]WNZ05475.1 hypothetical protein PVT25_08135 [Paenarthrobacter ureafaciens]